MIRWILSSSALIGFTLALGVLLKDRLSPRLRYALWLPVLLRLLIPGSLWSVPELFTRQDPAGDAAGVPFRREYALCETREYDPRFLPRDAEGYVILDLTEEPAPDRSAEEPKADAAHDAGEASAGKARRSLPLLPLLWAMGAGAVLLWSLIGELRFSLRLGRSGRRIKAAGCPLAVYACAWLKTPCLAGLLRGRIYVPEGLDRTRGVLGHALAHELAHARHGDLLWARLRCLALALHWFNPLVWLAALRSKQDGEMACDESAIRRLGEEQRCAYGRTLLRLSCPERGDLLCPLPSLGGRGAGFRERIRRVAKSPRPCAWALILAMTLSLFAAGCAFSAEKGAEGEGWYYQSSFSSLDLPDEMLVDLCFSGDRLYALTMTEERSRLFSFDHSGGDRREIPLPEIALPELPEGASPLQPLFNRLLSGPEGTLCLLGSLAYTVPEDTEIRLSDGSSSHMEVDSWGSASFVLFLDGTGAIRQLYTLPDYSGIGMEATDAQGRLYLVDAYSSLRIYDPEGHELVRTGLDGYCEQLIRLRDGRVAAAFLQNSAKALFAVDPDSGALERILSVPTTGTEALTAVVYTGAFDRELLVNTGTLLFGVGDKGEREPMVTWLNADLDGNLLRDVCPGEDGDTLYCAFGNRYGSSYGSGIARILRTKEPPAEERRVLTLACMGLDDSVAELVLHFNRTDPEYRIVVQDYSVYNTSDSPDAGYTRLSTEIAAGKVPDLFCTADLPVRSYARQGLLEDLWPYIDADAELGGREALVSPLFGAMSQEGGLYQVSAFFTIYTVVGAAPVVGERNGWSIEDFRAAYAQMPEDCLVLSPNFTRDSVLNASLCIRLDSFLDWDSGLCRFDSEEFRELIRFSELFPLEPDLNADWGGDYERMGAGEQMLNYEHLISFTDISMLNAQTNGQLVYVGLPGATGNGSAFHVENGLAMSADTPYKEAAWRFLRTMLDRDQQIRQYNAHSPGFPTNREAFDRLLAQAMEPRYRRDANGELILNGAGEPIQEALGGFQVGSYGRIISYYAVTEEQAARFLDLMEHTECLWYWDDAVMDIVHGEVPAYYSGERSLEEVSASIQKRAQIYMEEQK